MRLKECSSVPRLCVAPLNHFICPFWSLGWMFWLGSQWHVICPLYFSFWVPMLQGVSAMCSFMLRFLIFLLFRIDCWLPWGICKHRRPVGLPQTLVGGSFSISVLLHFHCCKEILWPRPLLEGTVYCGITIPDSDSLWWSCREYGSRKVVMALAIPRYLGLHRDTVRKH